MNDMRYLRQALAMMREERLFSSIYIVGTALAIKTKRLPSCSGKRILSLPSGKRS